jgi:putative ABC transport system ATP-binding protein
VSDTRRELRASSIGVDIGGQTLLNDVNLVISPGTMLVVTGASGSGKTTLAHTLAGIVEPDRGEVTLGGIPIKAVKEFADRPALVTQDFGLISVLTAAETVSLPLRVRSLPKETVRDRTAEWLGALGLESCANRPVEELSGGQRQRVAIARALAMGAEVIVMDEPTAELDPTNRALLLSLLEIELSRGVTLVIVSHETDVIARADTVYELAKLR